MAQQSNRFVPSLESLDERLNLSPAASIGEPVTFTFTLGSVPAADHPDLFLNVWINQDTPAAPAERVPRYWVFGTELPANSEVRHRTFAIVDRTQLSGAGVVLLASSLPGVNAGPAERIGPFFQFESSRLSGAAELQGTLFIAKQQALRDRVPYGVRNADAGADAFLAVGGPRIETAAVRNGRTDDLVGWDFISNGNAAGLPGSPVTPLPSRIILRERLNLVPAGGVYVDADGLASSGSAAGLRNRVTLLSFDVERPGGPVYQGSHILYQDIFIPTATANPIVFTRDGKASGL